MNTKRIFDAGSVVALIALIAFGIFAVAGGLGGDSTSASDQAREASCLAGSTDCNDTGGDALGVCVEGVTDCVDTAVGDGDSTDYICIAPEEGGPEECKDSGGSGTAVDPVCPSDQPECSDSSCSVSSDGQVRCVGVPPDSDGGGSGSSPGSSGDIDSNECSLVHNIEVCEKIAVEAAWSLLESDGVTGEITLVSAKAVEWPDACLGVTNPDVACAEVITPGYIVLLQRNDIEYEFHTDLNGNAVLAEPAQ